MSYYTQPPQLRSSMQTYSIFARSRLIRNAVEMVAWADHEYKTALNIAIEKKRWKSVKIMSDEWSGMRVLSRLEDFHWFCAMLAQDAEAWNKLDRKTRKFICKAMEWYEGLREVRAN